MGYCCFCIPLTVYGLVYACVEILFCTIDMVLSVHSVPEDELDELDLAVLEFVFNITVIITAVSLIYGIVRRRYEYFVPYLILMVTTIGLSCLAIFVVVFISPHISAVILVVLVLTCLLAFPIYLLYVEIRNEHTSRINV